jgi:tRNA threonylcarbamoyladenosine modification (KEOPS) complex  Pcc1 subunit
MGQAETTLALGETGQFAANYQKLASERRSAALAAWLSGLVSRTQHPEVYLAAKRTYELKWRVTDRNMDLELEIQEAKDLRQALRGRLRLLKMILEATEFLDGAEGIAKRAGPKADAEDMRNLETLAAKREDYLREHDVLEDLLGADTAADAVEDLADAARAAAGDAQAKEDVSY